MRVIYGSAEPRRRSAIEAAYDEFRLDRQGELVSPRTLEYYDDRIGQFLAWLTEERPDVRRMQDLDVGVVREYRAYLSGRKRDDGTDRIRVIVWENTAQVCVKYLEKGARVQVDGRLRGDFYDSKQTGKKKLGMEVVGQRVDFLSRPASRGAGSSADDNRSEPEEGAEVPRSNGRAR